MKTEIEISPPPPNSNKMLHMTHGHKAGVRRRILKEVAFQVLMCPKPIQPMVTISIHLFRVSTRMWDEGNLGSGGSLKWVVDALVKLNILKDDSPKEVIYSTPTQEFRKRSRIDKGAIIVKLEWDS